MSKFNVGDEVEVVDAGAFNRCTGTIRRVESRRGYFCYWVELSDEWSVTFSESELGIAP